MACKRRPASPLTTPAPPDDLGPNGALKTPTTASTRHRRGLQAVLNIVLTIAALRGEMTMEKAVYLTKKATRNLAKRQLTWFRRDPRVIWLNAEGETARSLSERMRDRIAQSIGQ